MNMCGFLRFSSSNWRFKKKCKLCGRESLLISDVIGVCADCLRNNPKEALKIALRVHFNSRLKFNLPPRPPKNVNGVRCGICDLNCIIPPGGRGFCGLRVNVDGRLIIIGGSQDRGLLEWYYDPLPTNCVAGWFCPGNTGLGYPKYSCMVGGERGYFNLAVFYGACNSNCLFCQNWNYRFMLSDSRRYVSSDELASKVNGKTRCVCFFGGDPSPQVIHALKVSEKILEMAEREDRLIRICWESNGHFSRNFLSRVVDVSLNSGGIVKFDLKAWSNSIYKALTGIDPGNLFENVKYIVDRSGERREVPLFAASILLVPGYVDDYEVEQISSFLASLDRDIPLSLLAFHPDFLLVDLPPTSFSHAEKALRIAREAGLRRINIGNRFLLGDYY